MLETTKIEIMNVKMHSLTMIETIAEINRRMAESEFTQHVVVNVAKLVHMQTDFKLREAVHACDIINIDGMGVVMLAKFLGHAVSERVAGIDLFHLLIEYAQNNNHSVYLLGAREGVIEKAVLNILNKHPKLIIAGYHHGYIWENEDAVVKEISASGASMLFVAISSPMKEEFINRWRGRLGVKFAMGVGGTFDIIAGINRRAPLWMQEAGLEWLYRVIQEPQRMWKRYLITNCKFIVLILKAKLMQIMSDETYRKP